MENPFIESVAKCLKFAVENLTQKDMPVVIIYDPESKTVIAKSVSNFVANEATLQHPNTRILCRIDHEFFRAAQQASFLNQPLPRPNIVNI